MTDEELIDTGKDDEQERPRIKVTDRRQFDRDGNPKAALDHETAVATDEAKPPSAAEAATDDGSAEEPAADEPRIAAPAASIADLPRDFSAFVEGMYLEAMLYLGAIPDPRSGETIEDIELAKYKIDLLGMLQGKTEGNLTSDEKQQLEEVLYQLRMVFLQKTSAVKS